MSEIGVGTHILIVVVTDRHLGWEPDYALHDAAAAGEHPDQGSEQHSLRAEGQADGERSDWWWALAGRG